MASGRAGGEGSRSDPSLEGSMWRLGSRGGGDVLYPERPDEPDCIYYLRTGVCGYGSRCQFNHPRNRPHVLGGVRREAGEYPERLGQPVCQHFMQTGTCKFGASCKYHHPKQGGGARGDSVAPVSLNHMGFPLRPGEKECSYYLRTGQCKFGSTCRYHHPVPPSLQAQQHQHSQSVPPSPQYGVVMPRPQILQGSYLQSPYGYNQMVVPHGMVPYSGWNPYQASMGSSSVYGATPLSSSAPAYQSGLLNEEQSFPQRPGQPECQYYLRTKDCKFGASCRYHHPLETESPKEVTLSQIGLPLRPGAAKCTDFAQHGVCKLGTACKSDHSMDSYPPVSSSLGTLTLASSSSSSSEQRAEVLPSTSGGSETLAAAGVSSSSMTSGVSHSETVEAKT